MKFINEKGEKINLDDFKFLNHGNCANTYYNNNIVFKKYKPTTQSEYKIDSKVFNILKDINNPNFIKLYDIYMLTTLKERFSYLLNITKFRIDAYTAKYYKKDYIDPLYINKDYLLSNLYTIEKIFCELSRYRVKVGDIHAKNTIYTKDLIIIIDPDFFQLSNSSQSEIEIINKKYVLTLFESMIENSSGLFYDERNSLLDWVDDNFTKDSITEKTNVTDFIAKQLRHVKRPIDLVRK